MAGFNIYKKEIEFPYTAQYCTSHPVTGKEKEIWIIFHGYGQLSEYFLHKFQPVFDDNKLFVAPEATNYSYLNGFSGRVGANWMTSHERELAILNNHKYLNTLLIKLLENFKQMPSINVFGFSQGAATASRWLSQIQYPVEKLILWAGGFAHDLSSEEMEKKLNATEVCVILGEKDDFITKEALEKQEEFIRRMNHKILRYTYPEGHIIYLPLLKKIFEVKE